MLLKRMSDDQSEVVVIAPWPGRIIHIGRVDWLKMRLDCLRPLSQEHSALLWPMWKSGRRNTQSRHGCGTQGFANE
jgi:hypothetical protein